MRTSDRRARRYRVVAREEWPKTATPLDRLFSRVRCSAADAGHLRRRLPRGRPSYRDNIAVTAVPEGAG